MQIKNWTLIEESQPFERLPMGGYVVKITDVDDYAKKKYLTVVYDIAEGEYAGYYDTPFGNANPWAHSFIRSYKDTAEGMFKAFLLRLEESNRPFKIAEWEKTGNEKALIGLELGVVLREEKYTNEKTGEDKDRIIVDQVVAAQDIRNKEYRIKAPLDKRTQVKEPEEAPKDVYDDIPFE